MTEDAKAYQMETDPLFDDEQMWQIETGIELNFRHENASSVGYQETLKPKNWKAKKSGYDPFLFDKQFLRYSQVLETDYS